jgi:cell division protease FtsH
MAELEEARDKVRWGRERRSLAMTDEDKKFTAWHEARSCLGERGAFSHSPIAQSDDHSSRAVAWFHDVLPKTDILSRRRKEMRIWSP